MLNFSILKFSALALCFSVLSANASLSEPTIRVIVKETGEEVQLAVTVCGRVVDPAMQVPSNDYQCFKDGTIWPSMGLCTAHCK